MKKFMDQDFLLETETAKVLYDDHAAKMPICDFRILIKCAGVSPRTKYLTILGISGSEETTISGARSEQTESKKEYVTGNRFPSRKNSANGQRRSLIHSVFSLYHWTHLS